MKKAPALALLFAALAVVVLQAMALATRYFQPWLDSDYLLPQRFAADVIGGVYPLSGWTLSSSPYLFPDFALSLIWHAMLGSAPLLPFYVVTSFLLLALLAGWSLERINPSPGHGWLAGALVVNLLLAWQGTADHARWLWWLGTATFHGGAVLLGLAQFALWAGPADVAPSRTRTAVATGLLFLGLASDTLLLTQFVAPLGLALFLTAGRPRWRAPRVRTFLASIGIALLLLLALRGMMLLAGWWNFPNVVRYAPTPSAVSAAAGRMFTDLTGAVPVAVPGFVVLALVAGTSAACLCLRRHRIGGFTTEQRQAGWFVMAALGSTLLLPVLAVYWQNPQHGRYLLPCLVLPPWWLASLLPLEKFRGPPAAVLIALALLATTVWRAPQIRFEAWSWPYPAPLAELDRFLAAEGRDRGLADFWRAHTLTTLSRSGLRLHQLRPDGRVQFWGNNAFHHFDAESANETLQPPGYSFILANGLDPVALRLKFGEPTRIATVAEYEVWLYDGTAAQNLNTLVDAEVRTFLGDRPGTERIAQP